MRFSVERRTYPAGRIRRALLCFLLVLPLSCNSFDRYRTPDFVDCSVFPAYAGSPYVLPYAEGQQWEVGNTFGHYTTLNGGVGLYAIDLRMPIGTEVTAARAGLVVAIEEGFSDDDHLDLHENWVMVRHQDNTVGRYIHLTRNGALVDVGDAVDQGEVIGLSGNSGASSRPHLHFDVQTCGPNLPPGYNDPPCGQTVPVSFRNTAAHTCGLLEERSYPALSYTPDDR
jgi:murein DD-endopeptidase MepM/ murein hydrolase activator NlpD